MPSVFGPEYVTGFRHQEYVQEFTLTRRVSLQLFPPLPRVFDVLAIRAAGGGTPHPAWVGVTSGPFAYPVGYRLVVEAHPGDVFQVKVGGPSRPDGQGGWNGGGNGSPGDVLRGVQSGQGGGGATEVWRNDELVLVCGGKGGYSYYVADPQDSIFQIEDGPPDVADDPRRPIDFTDGETLSDGGAGFFPPSAWGSYVTGSPGGMHDGGDATGTYNSTTVESGAGGVIGAGGGGGGFGGGASATAYGSPSFDDYTYVFNGRSGGTGYLASAAIDIEGFNGPAGGYSDPPEGFDDDGGGWVLLQADSPRPRGFVLGLGW